MNLITVTLHNGSNATDTWYREVSDSVLHQLKATPRGSEDDPTYNLVIGSSYMPFDWEDPLHVMLFEEIGADDESTERLGWQRLPSGNYPVVFKILYLFDD